MNQESETRNPISGEIFCLYLTVAFLVVVSLTSNNSLEAQDRPSTEPARVDLSRYTWGPAGAESLSALIELTGSVSDIEAAGIHLNYLQVQDKYTAILTVEQYYTLVRMPSVLYVLPFPVDVIEPMMMKNPPLEHVPVPWTPARFRDSVLFRIPHHLEDLEIATNLDLSRDLRVLMCSNADSRRILEGLKVLQSTAGLDDNELTDMCQLVEFPSYEGTESVDNWSNRMNRLLGPPTNRVDVVLLTWDGPDEFTEKDVDNYLLAAHRLEVSFPSITFVYSTGMIHPAWDDENYYSLNNRIRWFCDDSNKVLLDLSYLDSHDPAGKYHGGGVDDCSWCEDWCASHSCPECEACQDSHCLICYRKSVALIWILGHAIKRN